MKTLINSILIFCIFTFLLLKDEWIFNFMKNNDYMIYNYNKQGTAFQARKFYIKDGKLVDNQFIITNAHLCRGASALLVAGYSIPKVLKVIKIDENLDLCMLEAFEHKESAYIIGSIFYKGESVRTGGHPLGKPFRTSMGEILERAIDGIDTTLKIEHGASGSPVINSFGIVVGVIVAIDPDYGQGYMIDIDDLNNFINGALSE
jgi:S1-C subfamily serine protease